MQSLATSVRESQAMIGRNANSQYDLHEVSRCA